MVLRLMVVGSIRSCSTQTIRTPRARACSSKAPFSAATPLQEIWSNMTIRSARYSSTFAQRSFMITSQPPLVWTRMVEPCTIFARPYSMDSLVEVSIIWVPCRSIMSQTTCTPQHSAIHALKWAYILAGVFQTTARWRTSFGYGYGARPSSNGLRRIALTFRSFARTLGLAHPNS